jgi:hypothetical protein
VHIIWTDKRGHEDYAQIYHTKLDPSLDDQNGDSANEMAITLIDDTALTPDDGHKRNLPTSAIHCGHYIHLTWYEDWEQRVISAESGYLHYMILDWNGNIVVGDTALTAGKTADSGERSYWTMAYLDVDSNGKAHIVWCDNRHLDVDGNDYTEQFGSPPGGGDMHRDGDDFGGNFGQYKKGWEVYYTNYQGPTCPEPPPVGGEAYPVSKASLLAPWIAVGLVLAGGISWYVLRRRKTQS